MTVVVPSDFDKAIFSSGTIFTFTISGQIQTTTNGQTAIFFFIFIIFFVLFCFFRK